MLRGLIAIALLAVLVTAVTASAAYLEVSGGTLMVASYPTQAVPEGQCGTLPPGTTCIEIPAPPAPGDLDCDFESSEGTLTWEPSPGATGYSVYHSPKGEEVFEFLHDVDGGDATTTTVVGPPAIGHLFRLIAVGPGGKSEPSNSVHCPPN